PPVLALGAERVGRRAERDVEQELLLPRPDVGAVAVDHEWEIAQQLHAVRVLPRRGPLRRGNPLEILIEEDLARELAPRLGDRSRIAPLQRIGPFGPRVFALTGVQRAEDPVVLDPPGLLAQKSFQAARAIRVAAPLRFREACARGRRPRL